MPLQSEQPERRRIRRALIDLCFERGHAKLTVADLCERAEVDPARFAQMFASLDECFYEINRAEFEAFWADAERRRCGASSWRERLRATAHVLYEYIAADEKRWHFMFVEILTAGEPAQLQFEEQIQRVVDLVDEGRHEPGAPASVTRATAEAVSGGILTKIYTTVGQGEPVPPQEEIVPELMYGVVLPYLGPHVAQQELRRPAGAGISDSATTG